MAKVRTLGDPSCYCHCGDAPLAARQPEYEQAAGRALGQVKPRRRISKGTGPFCVFSKNDKKVRCFRDRAVAEKVARGFGPGFRVGPNED